MLLPTLFFALISLVLAQTKSTGLNTTKEYQLQTCLKPGQNDKSQYNNLWLSSYHTGAGLNDVVFHKVQSGASKAFLNATNVTSSSGTQYYNQLFDLGNDFPWGLQMDQNTAFYAAWEPVRMNAGVGGSDVSVSGFFLNSTGLQWTTSVDAPGSANDAFGGWIGEFPCLCTSRDVFSNMPNSL
jgi:hypothetical protein